MCLSRQLQPSARGPGCRGPGELRANAPPVRRSLPIWCAAVIPSMLVGHAAAYALAGRTVTDARHGWLAPTLECSLAVLLGVCTLLLASTLLRWGIFKRTKAERSLLELWPRLALAQLVLFGAIENWEGAHVTLLGIAAQLVTALCAAYLLSLFSRLIVRCIAGADRASRYLERLLTETVAFAGSEPAPRSFALLACAGHSRFQRPPPLR